MRNTPHCISLITAATLVAASSSVVAATAATTNFDFTSGTQGWHRYGNATLLTTANDTTFNSGNSLQIPVGTNGAIYNFTSVTLGNGESLSMAFDFHFNGTTGTQAPRVFFGNQVDTITNAVNVADTSYYTNIASGNTDFSYNDSGDAGIAGSGGVTNMTGSGSPTIPDVGVYRIVYTITNNNGYYDFMASVGSVQKTFSGFGVSTADVSNFQNFNTFGIIQGSGTGASSYAIDNVTFTVVPEPSVALLGCFGALALLRRRRA